MGIYVVPFRHDGWNHDGPYKRTLELTFPPCSIMAYATLCLLIPRNEFGSGGVGIKSVRRRLSNGADQKIVLGHEYNGWPKAWCGDNISAVTFAAAVYDESYLEAVAVIHTW